MNAPSLFILSIGSLFIVLFHFYTPSFLLDEYKALIEVLNELQKNGAQLQPWLQNKNQIIAYLLGIQTMVFLLSTLSSLMIARAFQSKLFYPNGFKIEMLAFRSQPLSLIPFAFIMLGLYFQNSLALSLLPIWAAYMAAGGLSTIVALFASRHRALITFFLLLVAISFLPFIMLPIVVGIGALDGLFNFRQRFNQPKSNTKSS